MRTAIATLAAFAAFTTPAAAQATATATPDRAGAGARLHTEVDASQPPLAGRIPQETVITVDRGFRFDGRAVTRRCTAAQADSSSCPAQSGIGSAVVVADYAGSEVTVPIDLYLARPFQAGDLAGIVATAEILGSQSSAKGRLTRIDGALSVVLSSPVPDAASFGVTVKSLTADVGVTRIVKRKRRKVRIPLLRNPATCTDGAWDASASFTFSDGSTADLATPIACRP